MDTPTPLGLRVRATPLARATIWSIGTYGIVQGLMILGFDDLRFSSPSFEVLRAVPGGYNTWGWAALVLGACILIASARRHFALKAAGLIGIAAWSTCFAVGILVAAVQNPRGATTGVPTYTLIAVCAAIVVWVDERKTWIA